MEANLKKILKAVVLEIRHALEGYYDNAGKWFPGDLEQRLAEIGVRKDRASVPVDELGRLSDEDRHARKIIDGYIQLREEAGVGRSEAVAEYVRESAYTWANRLVALRCMEARELLEDEVIVGRDAYGGRSLVHHRLAQTSPELCTGEDDGRFAMLAQVFAERSQTLPMLFDLESPSIALRPSPAALTNCLAWLSGTEKVRSNEPVTDAVFAAPDAFGWAYQYWNTEEKDRVFETVRTKKGAKIEGADIISATQLYTEDYMVKFLVQNSLGATWMGIHPESGLSDNWEYYVRDADRALVKKKTLRQITLLDPACGSGHFLIEAFDMFYAMYEEEGEITEAEEICRSILENNLFGIDIDERAIQIAEASLWMKAEERAFGFCGATTNLVAATSSHLNGDSWERYLAKLESEPSTVRVLRKFAVEMEHIDELGSLARPAEALETIIKQEHELWEEQERERHEADKSLFKEIRDDVLASHLPFQDITDKEFFARTMRHALFAIDGFTAEARESGEFNDQLMGVEAKTGFRLLDLLSRKYDVVVANPPYMGKKNMSRIIRSYIEKNYTEGKRDLYAAFMLSASQRVSPLGRVGVVVPQSWMFFSSFDDLRVREHDECVPGEFTGLLNETRIETLAQLGRHAFSEIDPPSNVVLVCWRSQHISDLHEAICYRLNESRPANEQADLLRDAICVATSKRRYKVKQFRFLEIPNAPLSYWLGHEWLELFHQHKKLGDVAYVREGLHTTDNVRFVRCFWECPNTTRWVPYLKGGGYARWAGLQWLNVDWQNDGIRIRNMRAPVIPSYELYFRPGFTYTDIARGNLGARAYSAGAIFDAKGPVILAYTGETDAIAAIVNSRPATYIMRALSPTQQFRPGYVASLPIPNDVESLASHAKHCVYFANVERSRSLTEFGYQGPISENSLSCLRRSIHLHFREQWLASTSRLIIEATIDRETFGLYGLDISQRERCYDVTGRPAGSYELAQVNSSLTNDTYELPPIVRDLLLQQQTTLYSRENGRQLVETIRECFTSWAVKADANAESLPEDLRAQAPCPPDSFIESMSHQLQLNPVSLTAILLNGVETSSWKSSDAEANLIRDFVTEAILRCLGYRWPMELVSKKMPSVDSDGVVPITGLFTSFERKAEQTIYERLVACTQTDNASEIGDSEVFESYFGTSLDDWLSTEFFKFHVKQFKKRPIAWQLQTSNFTSRKSPAFACLVYYHRLDIDAIAKIRTQYTGPLKLRFETEMRGISSTPAADRSDRQAKRNVELEEAITELQAFDDKLAAIAKSGFGPTKLLPKLRQYAFDDAMLAMKARWLKRLSELLIREELDGWKNQAEATGLHPELASWIDEALSHLAYFCSRVGPDAPEAKKTPDDPTAADFAREITGETVTMQCRSIEMACGVWWGKFDAAVLAPIKERIKQLKAEQKELNAAIKEGRQPVLDDAPTSSTPTADDTPLFTDDEPSEQTTELTKAAMKARVKEVKAKIKKFTDEMNLKSGKAQAVRDAIQTWNSSEPNNWHDWLTDGPLFDQVSSLDGRRSVPKTITEFIDQESLYAPDINDGVRVNIAPLQKAGVLAADVLAAKDIDKAIADRAEWRADERRWVREGKLPQCGWWKETKDEGGGVKGG